MVGDFEDALQTLHQNRWLFIERFFLSLNIVVFLGTILLADYITIQGQEQAPDRDSGQTDEVVQRFHDFI